MILPPESMPLLVNGYLLAGISCRKAMRHARASGWQFNDHTWRHCWTNQRRFLEEQQTESETRWN